MEDGELSVTLSGLIVMLMLSVHSYSMPQEVVCYVTLQLSIQNY